MANLRKKVLGTVSGAVGDILFRSSRGKNIIGIRPLPFTPGTDPASVARRQRFGMATTLSRQINAIPQLKNLWKQVTEPEFSAYNKIVKENYHNVQHNSVSDLIRLVPEIGFALQTTIFDVAGDAVHVTIAPIGTNSGIDPAIEIKCITVGVIHLSNPSVENVSPHVFINVSSASVPLLLDRDISIDIFFFSQVTQLINQYQNKKVFLSLLTLDVNDQVINYSNTFFN